MEAKKPLTIVVFGATGDLFQKKLIFALFNLYMGGFLPKQFKLIGFARRPLSHEDFRIYIKEILQTKSKDLARIDMFLTYAFYERGDMSLEQSFKDLSESLGRYDTDFGVCSNKMFYLAVPPILYKTILKHISASGLTMSCIPDLLSFVGLRKSQSFRAPGTRQEKQAWTRVLIEKPFGNNLIEARSLDTLLGKLFEENQIFRIDHYLAKETIQNILSFRFSNALFEPLWNRKFIEQIEIKFLESNVVGNRGSSYDDVGALRDVGQNHILQILALISMENPDRLESELIRTERARVLKKVRIYKGSKMVRAQYEGYRQEKGVVSSSQTESYFRLALEVKNSRFRGVPFYIESGKALNESKVEVTIHFKAPKEFCVCPIEHKEGHQNILTFSIQPNEAISLLFWAKAPGFNFGLEPQNLSFSQARDTIQRKIPDAYERVLYDAIIGDQTLFTNTAEVLAEWGIIMPVLNALKKTPLKHYKQNSKPGDFIAKI